MTLEKGHPGEATAGPRHGRSVVGGFVAVIALLIASVAVPVAGAQQETTAAHGDDGFTSGTVNVRGGSIHYVTAGDGPPLVLLHGWPQTWETWRGVMPALAEDHTVIAMDLPGLGDSSVPRDGYDKRTTAQRIHQAVRKLGYHRVDLVGHDLGALVAYPYAREFPRAVNRMAVIDSPLPGYGLEDFYGTRWHFLFNMSSEPIPEQIVDDDDVETYLGMMFDGAQRPDAIDRETYYAAYADPAVRSAGYDYYRAFPDDADYNRAHADRRLPMPVLAMGAEATFGPVVADSFENVADDVRAVVVPDSGHFIPEENPRFFVDCVKHFLGSASAPPPPRLAACAA